MRPNKKPRLLNNGEGIRSGFTDALRWVRYKLSLPTFTLSARYLKGTHLLILIRALTSITRNHTRSPQVCQATIFAAQRPHEEEHADHLTLNPDHATMS
jgi:hypothetical protein